MSPAVMVAHHQSDISYRLIVRQNPKARAGRLLRCKGIQLPLQKRSCSCVLSRIEDAAVRDWKWRSCAEKTIDVATMGNLCVDVVLHVPTLPPPSRMARLAYIEKSSASPPDEKYWEAGGNCNMAIAASRLGLCCATIGHLGDDIYGRFIVDVLSNEDISMIMMKEHADLINPRNSSYETLLCWVFVDPLQKHGFCSKADVIDGPAFSWMNQLSERVKLAIKRSRVLFCNGYGFDELTPSLLLSALDYSVKHGTSFFFDPGPRGRSLSSGTPEQQQALDQLLKMSDVILLTSDEAESLTGIENPIQAGKQLLRDGICTKWVIIKMGSLGSILITPTSTCCAPAFKVNVIDTVGCGDSFVAAVAFGFIHKMPLINTLAIANAVGAATAMGCGAGRNVAQMEQVMRIIRASHTNEDCDFWNRLFAKSNCAREITFLSSRTTKDYECCLKLVSLQELVPELLDTLESDWSRKIPLDRCRQSC